MFFAFYFCSTAYKAFSSGMLAVGNNFISKETHSSRYLLIVNFHIGCGKRHPTLTDVGAVVQACESFIYANLLTQFCDEITNLS